MNALARLESADRLLRSRAGNAWGLSRFRIFVRLRTNTGRTLRLSSLYEGHRLQVSPGRGRLRDTLLCSCPNLQRAEPCQSFPSPSPPPTNCFAPCPRRTVSFFGRTSRPLNFPVTTTSRSLTSRSETFTFWRAGLLQQWVAITAATIGRSRLA